MAKSGNGLHVLYGEGDSEVLSYQLVSIEKAGHTVTSAVGRKAVEEALRTGKFDLVVLGSSLSRNDRHHLPYMVKKAAPGTRVLVLHADGGRHHEVDDCLESGWKVEELLAKIAALAPKAAAAGAGR
jgi:DNA-binding response OmpR family regulator